ncbi:MAG: hypothetical protein H6757_03130 [Candidatus Omnitrophica bacterium]|nr:hypothetical protein [Candidatus Omnitrophota bacterium]
MVQIYKKKWQRNAVSALVCYIRDWLVLILPFRRLPSWLVRVLYGENFQFAFLVHPRAYHDIFISMPAFKPFKFLFRREKGYRFFSRATPFVLNTVITKQKINGCVIGQLTVPEVMFDQRKATLQKLEMCIRLVSKICETNAVVGLGGWFPMVTKRGAKLKPYATKLGVIVTNGHCGTLASIYLTTERLMRIAGMNLADACIAVIGVGKMGTNVVRAFNGRVKKLILIDINQTQITKAEDCLRDAPTETLVECFLLEVNNKGDLKGALQDCHVGVCATSSYRNILKLKDLPPHFIAIDDSRPEALPRDPKKEKIILEGGLLKIKEAGINYNYGFGDDDNVFGCLGEAFLLACNHLKDLKPTLAEVDMANFFNLLKYCESVGVTAGDLKTGEMSVLDEDVRESFMNRGFLTSRDSYVGE